jgi:hypothetical protein
MNTRNLGSRRRGPRVWSPSTSPSSDLNFFYPPHPNRIDVANEQSLFLRACLESFAKHGPKALARAADEQPASYLKIFALLMPRDLKIEHSSPLAALSDEQLALMIADLEQRIAARLSGGEAKVINGNRIYGAPATRQ